MCFLAWGVGGREVEGEFNLQASCHFTTESAHIFTRVLKTVRTWRRNKLRSFPYNSRVSHESLITLTVSNKKKGSLGKHHYCACPIFRN